MIGQYLSNTNKIDTIHILQNILQVNKALLLFVQRPQPRFVAATPAAAAIRQPDRMRRVCLFFFLMNFESWSARQLR